MSFLVGVVVGAVVCYYRGWVMDKAMELKTRYWK